jgi:multisubunit Na+/H+ antiporter MnhF subunit
MPDVVLVFNLVAFISGLALARFAFGELIQALGDMYGRD